MKLEFKLRHWTLGGKPDASGAPTKQYQYTSSPSLDVGDYTDVTFELSQWLLRSPIYLNAKKEKRSDVPDQRINPEGFNKWLTPALERFIQMFKNETQFIVAKSLLYPAENSPSVEDVWETTTIEQRMSISAFFLNNALLQSATALLSGKSSEDTAKVLDGPLKTISQRSTKTTSLLPLPRTRTTSGNTSKTRKKSVRSR